VTSWLEPVRDRKSTISPERFLGDSDTGRGLPALVLIAVDHGRYTMHEFVIEANRDDLISGHVEFDVAMQDRVEFDIRR
jgi:hypothetical protein